MEGRLVLVHSDGRRPLVQVQMMAPQVPFVRRQNIWHRRRRPAQAAARMPILMLAPRITSRLFQTALDTKSAATKDGLKNVAT